MASDKATAEVLDDPSSQNLRTAILENENAPPLSFLTRPRRCGRDRQGRSCCRRASCQWDQLAAQLDQAAKGGIPNARDDSKDVRLPHV